MIEQTPFAKAYAWIGALIPAIIGSVISLRINSGNTTFMSIFLAYVSGVAVAFYGGNGIIDWFQISREHAIDEAIILTCGIFGMAAVTEISKQLPELIRNFFEKLIEFVNPAK